jgi:hypothetical protein
MLHRLKRFWSALACRVYTNDTVVVFRYCGGDELTSSVTIVRADTSNITDVLSFQPERYVDIFRQFMASGHVGYLAYINGCCVHRSWVVPGPSEVSLHRFLSLPLRADDAFIHYCETALAARGKNVYPAVLSQIARDFRDTRRLLVSTTGDNVPSLRAIQKAGFIELARNKIRVVLGLKFISDRLDR